MSEVPTAFIFAAGRGKRMGALTDNTPKPLLKVQGKPLIENTLERLKKAGYENIVVNVAYLGEQIKTFLGGGEKWGLTITVVEEPYPLETGGGILNALPVLGDKPFVIANADVIADYPMEQLRDLVLPEGVLAHLILVNNPEENPVGDFTLDQDNFLQEKYLGSTNYTYSGLSVIDPKLISEYPQKREIFPLLEVFRYAIERKAIQCSVYKGLWKDVGTPERLAEIKADSQFNR